MLGVVAAGAFEAGGGVAVRAAEQTAVVHADILADHAAAGLALSGVFAVVDLQPKGVTNILVVDAFSRLNPINAQVNLFGAALDGHPILVGGLHEGIHQVVERLAGGILVLADLQAVLVELGNALAGLGVHVHQADDRTLGCLLYTSDAADDRT